MKRVLVPMLLCCLPLTACGGGTKTVTETAADDVAAPKTTAEPSPVDVKVTSPHDGQTLRRGRQTFRGTATPGAEIYVNEEGPVKASKGGAWRLKLPLSLGENEYQVTAEVTGRPDGEDWLTLTRKRTAAELAAVRQRRADALARKRAAAEARFQRDLQAALNGSTKKMSSRVAREITNRCSAGTLNDFDVCFEAGFKTGGDVAEKYAKP